MVYDQGVAGWVTLPDGACLLASRIVAVIPLDEIQLLPIAGNTLSYPPRIRVDFASGGSDRFDCRIINCQSNKQRDAMIEQIMGKIKFAMKDCEPQATGHGSPATVAPPEQV